MQYYLIDIENKKDINNSDGSVYLSEEGVLWIKYKDKKDIDIPKGAVFLRENSKMVFAKRK